jgi:hypothetical protein
MARYVLIQNNIIINTIELQVGNYTDNAEEAKDTGKWLVPEGCEVVQTNLGNIGQEWPIEE